MFHKVKEVYPLPNMLLSVIFTDGTTKTYDVKPLTTRFEVFKALEEIGRASCRERVSSPV